MESCETNMFADNTGIDSIPDWQYLFIVFVVIQIWYYWYTAQMITFAWTMNKVTTKRNQFLLVSLLVWMINTRCSESSRLTFMKVVHSSTYWAISWRSNDYMVGSYRDVIIIVVTKIASRRTRTTQSIVMY